MEDIKLLFCKHCGKIVEKLPNTHGCATMCCGEPMTELVANTRDAALEKHVPAVTIDGNKVHVQIGSVAHPMTEAHHISFVYLVTDREIRRHDFAFTDAPEWTFTIGEDEKSLKVYEYCNLHGLWVKEL